MTINIRVLEGVQKNKRIWSGIAKAKDLVDETRVKVDRYDAALNPLGYQRVLNVRRAQEFQRFIEATEMFSPSSILLNIRNTDIDRVTISEEEMVIGDGIDIWIVDGQTRIGGLKMLIDLRREDQFLDMDIPVIVTNVDRWEEAILFAIFNKTQIGVKFDLVETVLNEQLKTGNLQVQRLREWYDNAGIRLFKDIDTRLDASEISRRLNDTAGNPWHGMIIKPNEERSTSTGKIIRTRSFTVSLEPLIRKIRDAKAGVDNDEITGRLIVYWNGLEDVMPEAFLNRGDYVLQKSTGVMVLHSVYMKVLSTFTNRLDPPSDIEMRQGLNVLKQHIGNDAQRNFLTSDYWDAKNGRAGLVGTSRKSFNLITREIEDILDGYNRSRGTA